MTDLQRTGYILIGLGLIVAGVVVGAMLRGSDVNSVNILAATTPLSVAGTLALLRAGNFF